MSKYIWILDGNLIKMLERILEKLLNVINAKTHSPILDLINTWSTSLRNSDIDVKTLLNQLETQYISLSANKLGEFSMNDIDERRIKTILNNIKLLKAAVLAARTDGVDTINKVGYNVTVNELTQQGLVKLIKNMPSNFIGY